MAEVELREAEVGDARAVVQVHLASFPAFFLSTLGPGFLRVFYESLSAVDNGILIVACVDDQVVGFVGGTSDQEGLYRSMLSERTFQFVRAAAVAGARHPSAIPRLLRARRRARGDFDYMQGASLMTLGVAPQHGRKGIGSLLVSAFSQRLRADGIEQFSLTTDAVGNEGTNRFYISLGFQLERELVTLEGRRLNEYVRASG